MEGPGLCGWATGMPVCGPQMAKSASLGLVAAGHMLLLLPAPRCGSRDVGSSLPAWSCEASLEALRPPPSCGPAHLERLVAVGWVIIRWGEARGPGHTFAKDILSKEGVGFMPALPRRCSARAERGHCLGTRPR